MGDSEFESSPVLRFLVGAILGGLIVFGLFRLSYIPLWLGVSISAGVGTLAFFYGDQFLILVMKMMRGFH